MVANDVQTRDGWRLRLVTLDDIGGLHALASRPLVYRYLFDGAAPSREYITSRVTQSIANTNETGCGMWLLQAGSSRYAGCVELRPCPSPRHAELTYLLDPTNWGQGLVLRMAWTAITQAFRSSHIDYVIAGADVPNTASLAVMRRLGMRFLKDVQYPLGAGVEYVLHRDDAGPMPHPVLIPLG